MLNTRRRSLVKMYTQIIFFYYLIAYVLLQFLWKSRVANVYYALRKPSILRLGIKERLSEEKRPLRAGPKFTR
jgi:hypothetical protein